jgi:Tol biopolymer transport system component
MPGTNPAAQLARIGGLSAGLRSAMASLLTSDPHTRAEQFFVFRHELSAKPRGKGLAAAAVLIGLLTAAVWSRTGSQPASLKVSPATPFTTDPGEERFPDFSPDGEWVYYSARPNRSRETDIFVRPRSGDRARPITQTPEKEERPKASPDGSRIAFLRFPERGDIQVIVKDLSSGAETLAVAGNLHSFAWHPDAKRLIVSGTPSGTKVAGLYWVGLSPRSQSIFRSFDQTRDIDPEFSPDGKQLAVVREFGPYTEDLVVMDLDEKSNLLGTRRLTTRSVHARSLAYLPSGRQLVFLAGHAGLMTLWSAAVDGRTPPIQWKDDGQRLDYLAVSRARNVLVYGIDQEDANVWRASLGPDGELREAGPVISSTWSDDAPAVSPDGQHLVFLSTRSGNEQVWLARVDGSEARQLTRINGSINELSWAPDSRTILLSHTERGLSKSWTLDIRTGASREIYRETARGGARAFSRDGRSLYFASTRSGSYELYRMALETKAVERLTWKGGFVLAEDWDGKGIYFTPQRSAEGLWYMPFGSEPRQVAPELERRAFAASRSGVYFVAQRALWFWHKATGKVRKLWNPGKAFGFGLSLSPDERNLYFTIYDREGVDLTMVEDIER